MNGLRIAAGIMDPVDTTNDTTTALDKAYQMHLVLRPR